MKIWSNTMEFSEGKFLVLRRDGSVPAWPHFVMGARDPAVPAALRAYATEAERLGMDLDYVRSVHELADDFEAYRKREGRGDPDARPHRVDDPNVLQVMRGRDGGLMAWHSTNTKKMESANPLEHVDRVPPPIVEAMRVMLRDAVDAARKREPPSNGSMVVEIIGDRLINGGKWEPDGWTLQASFLMDTRFHPKPYISVHAYHASQCSDGCVQALVEYTPDDRRELAKKRLMRLEAERAEMDALITQTRQEIER